MAFLALEKNGSVFQYPFVRARGHSRSCSPTEKTLAVRSKPEGTVETVSLKMRQFLSLLRQDLGQILIMPGHYKKIMPAQQPIKARVLL